VQFVEQAEQGHFQTSLLNFGVINEIGVTIL